MDTIIDLCRATRKSSEDAGRAYEITTFLIQDYRLIRVALQEEFFPEGGPCPQQGRHFLRKSGSSEGNRIQRGIGFPWEKLAARRQERLRRGRREKLVSELKNELAPLLDERDDNCCFASRSMARCPGWRELLPLPEFEGYLKEKWVRRLLPHAVHADFTVLGRAAGLPELLCSLAPRMKSLLWVLPDRADEERLEDFAEDFYQEYGLAVDMRFPAGDASYRQMQVAGRCLKEPVNILDFMQDQHIPGLRPAAGSVWLDMAAVEEKERRIEARCPGVTYISLRKLWEQPQKM